MVDLTQITLTAGIPTGGTGTVATINALMADGGQVTIGNTADAAVVNPASAGTLVALLKGILTAANTIAARLPTALGADGSLKVDGDGGSPLPVSMSSVPTHNVFVQQKAFTSSANFTTGTTGYTAGDVIGPNGVAAALQFSGVASGAAVISIDETMFEIDRNAVISGETSYRLYLYNVTPPSAFTDNGVWDLSAAGDRTAFLGYIDLGTIVDLGSTCFVQQQSPRIIRTASSSIFGYIVTNGTYTPTAAVHKITLATRELG